MATQSNRSMVSEVSICNQALSWLGHTPITSLSDNSTSAQLCRRNYEFIRAAVLEERMWTFATVRAESVTAERDDWDTVFAHPVPLEWLAVFRVFRAVSGSTMVPAEWKLEGDKILTPEEKIFIWGITEVTDTAKWTMQFAQTVAARLAADLAIPLTENRLLQQDMWTLYENKLTEAAARDGQQGIHETVRADILTGARHTNALR